jgi:hypothetical protein
MDTDKPSATKPKAISAERGDTHTTFRIFTAHLDPAMREALRTTMHLREADVDTLRPQDELVTALRDLR